MKLRILILSLNLGSTLKTTHANDINLSWNVRTLQGQALSQTIKQAKVKVKKYDRSVEIK